MSTTASGPADKASALQGKGAAAPEILWAQRSSEDEEEKNVVMVTINVPNLPPAPQTKLDLRDQGFSFHATVAGDKTHGIEGREYAFDLDLFGEIDVSKSTVQQSAKSLYLILRKKEKKLEYWPRLSKDKIRLHNVKTDFDKWVDEDEQSGNLDDIGMGDGGMGGMDPSMMGGMGGGMPGMGGMGGMPGMGGAGGAGGMDLQAMLAQMQAGGGMGGAGGMPDFGAMGGGDDDDEDDDDDEGADEADAAGAEAGGVANAGIEEISTEGAASSSK